MRYKNQAHPERFAAESRSVELAPAHRRAIYVVEVHEGVGGTEQGVPALYGRRKDQVG